MKLNLPILAAVALTSAPALVSAAPSSNHTNGSSQTNGPSSTGQPSQDCQLLIDMGEGSTPGNSSSAPGSAFNPSGTAGTKYAGQQPQNSNNSASVSQYDVACLHGSR